jgi:hypothetical protein
VWPRPTRGRPRGGKANGSPLAALLTTSVLRRDTTRGRCVLKAPARLLQRAEAILLLLRAAWTLPARVRVICIDQRPWNRQVHRNGGTIDVRQPSGLARLHRGNRGRAPADTSRTARWRSDNKTLRLHGGSRCPPAAGADCTRAGERRRELRAPRGERRTSLRKRPALHGVQQAGQRGSLRAVGRRARRRSERRDDLSRNEKDPWWWQGWWWCTIFLLQLESRPVGKVAEGVRTEGQGRLAAGSAGGTSGGRRASPPTRALPPPSRRSWVARAAFPMMYKSSYGGGGGRTAAPAPSRRCPAAPQLAGTPSARAAGHARVH